MPGLLDRLVGLLVGGLLSLASDETGVGAMLGDLELDEEGVAGKPEGGLVLGEGELVVGAGASLRSLEVGADDGALEGAVLGAAIGCLVGALEGDVGAPVGDVLIVGAEGLAVGAAVGTLVEIAQLVSDGSNVVKCLGCELVCQFGTPVRSTHVVPTCMLARSPAYEHAPSHRSSFRALNCITLVPSLRGKVAV